MNSCFYGKNPPDCQYYPDCAKNLIKAYELQTGESLLLDQSGPSMLFHRTGSSQIVCNEYNYLLDSPSFMLIPDAETRIEALCPSIIFIFAPGLVRLLADKMKMDYFQTRIGAKKLIKCVSFIGRDTSVKLSEGMITEYLGCRHYVEHKFHEIVHTIDPARHKEIKKALSSKRWFFRIQVADLQKSCGSLTEFAYGMGLSESGFSKAFKKVFGQSFYNWFLDQKFEALTSDLIRSNLSFKELAGKHGFHSVAHLGFFIKKRTGLSAGGYRERLRAEIVV